MARTESAWAETQFQTDQEVITPPPGDGQTDLVGLLNAGGYYENFRNIPVGARGDDIDGPTGLVLVDDTTVIVNSPVYPGGEGKALSSTIQRKEPGAGYGSWGYGMEGADPQLGRTALMSIKDGGEMWFRQAVFYPTGFDWSTSTPGLKFLRTWRQESGNNTLGANELMIGSDGNLKFINERISPEPPDYEGPANGQGQYKWARTEGYLQRNRWHMVEFYIKFDKTPQPNHKGIMRCWLDGVPVGYDTGQTMPRDGARTAERALMHTYWNNGSEDDTPAIEYPTRTQTAYFSHTTIGYRGYLWGSNARVDHTAYMSRDSNGHPYFGLEVL